MFAHSRIAYFSAFLALLAPVLADVYRLDDRSPADLQEEDGFVAHNPDGEGSVIEHVRAELGDDDPWISTSTSYDLLKKGATTPGEIYIYTISENGIKFVDTKKAFEEAGEEHPHPGEEELSVKGKIDWDSIIKWDVYKRGKKTGEETRDHFEDGSDEESDDEDDKKRSVPLVRSVKFRA